MKKANTSPVPEPQDDAIVTKALFRAGTLLDLSQKDLAQIIGVSEPSLSRMARERLLIDPQSKQGEIALLFIRMFRSLDALFGGRENDMRAWFNAENAYLKNIPRIRTKSLEGLLDVVHYLDAMRGQV